MTPPPADSLEAEQAHACFFYETPTERLQILAQYIYEGLQNNELCILVTPGKPDVAIAHFADAGQDFSDAHATGALRIFGMDETYMPDGHFASDFMLQNVQSFLAEAVADGYSGLRTAGEMTWIDQHPQYRQAALEYESKVNLITPQDVSFTGLCLYSAPNSSGQVVSAVMKTHPAVIYEGTIRGNPYYELALS